MEELIEFPDRWSIEKAAVDFAIDAFQALLTYDEDTVLSWTWCMKRGQYDTFRGHTDETRTVVRLGNWQSYDECYDMPCEFVLNIEDRGGRWSFAVRFNFEGHLYPEMIEQFYPPFEVTQPRLMWVIGDAKAFRNWILLWKLNRDRDAPSEE